jgi:hypothetical protein
MKTMAKTANRGMRAERRTLAEGWDGTRRSVVRSPYPRQTLESTSRKYRDLEYPVERWILRRRNRCAHARRVHVPVD